MDHIHSVVYVCMCACNDAILSVATVFMIILMISNKQFAVAFRCLFTSFEPSDITVATRMTMAAIGHLNEFQIKKEDFDCYIHKMEQYVSQIQ